ncbi:MAG: bifunctional phosphopantothenoylcysteine decarboxylase/phosphopantothenate--cysteine ligase CoaBC, partial [Deferribacterales bacterium]
MSNILIGVTGGIAAYKIPSLCRLFTLSGDNVKVVMTNNATKFITPLTFESVTGNRVYIDDFETYIEPSDIKHISLSEWADIFIIAPATANTISKIANGIADNLLTSIALAYRFNEKPLLIAPAMNSNMYHNIFFKRNLNKLVKNGIYTVDPIEGVLACRDKGVGKMEEPEIIFKKGKSLVNRVNGILKGKKILVTAGPTVEYIDPVRFISNRSSGKMGYAIAEVAYEMGADVTLITGPTYLKTFVNKIEVTSADEMYNAVSININNIDILIMAAAVADYKVATKFDKKIKKKDETLSLHLIKNVDILKEISKQKSDKQFFVGFAAESHDLEQNALQKLKEKCLDMIVA